MSLRAECIKLRLLLFSRWLAAPPDVPRFSIRTTCDSFVFTFAYSPPSPYNAADKFELQPSAQLFPTEPKLLEVLGDAADWVTFYEGRERTCVVDALPACRSFRVRARACNAQGKGAWTAEEVATTRMVPQGCGGAGPGYEWDQTPEAVEVRVAVPAGTLARDVEVVAMPRRLRVAVRGSALLEGPLGGECVGPAIGDVEWELEGQGDSRRLLATLRKRGVAYEPSRQWDCLLEGAGHPKIDLTRLRWDRTDREWRPPQNAQTLEEVAQALPGNTVSREPLAYQRRQGEAEGEELAAWGGQWKGKRVPGASSSAKHK